MNIEAPVKYAIFNLNPPKSHALGRLGLQRSSLLKNLMSFSHHHDQLGGLSLPRSPRNQGQGGDRPLDLDRSINPILTGAYHITYLSPHPHFQTFLRPCSKRNESRALLELFDTVCHLGSLIVTLH